MSETPPPPDSAGSPDRSGGWSYRTGDWFGVFGPATTLLLPASEKGRVIDLWAAVDDGAPFDAVLDALLQRGLGALPGFVLVGFDAGPDARHGRVLVRGRGVRATVRTTEETVEIEAPSDATWAERTVAGLTALQVTTDDGQGAGSDDLPIVAGLVRVSRIDHPAVLAPAAEPPAAEPPAAVADVLGPPPSAPPTPPPLPPVAPAGDGIEEPTDVGALGAAAPADLPPTEAIDLVPVDEGSAEATAEATDDVAAAQTGGDPSAVAPPEEGWGTPPPPPFADLPPVPTGAAFDAPPPPGVPTGPAPHDPEPATDHDGLTQAGFDPGEFARVQPGIPGQPMAPSLTKPVARLVISDGQSVDVDRVILIGRAPEARRFTSTEQPLLVTVPSPLHEISSTHVEIRPGSGVDHGTAVVTDMGSTNGTVLVQPGLGPEDLKPGIAVQLIPGASINLGDGVIIDVTRP